MTQMNNKILSIRAGICVADPAIYTQVARMKQEKMGVDI